MADPPGATRRLNGAGNLSVLVVDDHAVVQWGFRLLLSRQPWIGRCDVASTPEEALERAERHKPDVALVDLFLGERSGTELCETLREASPKARVLLISGAGWISPEAAKAAGAAGFISKDWSADEVANAVRMVGRGMTVFARQAEGPATPLSTAREGGARADRRGGDEPRDRRAPLPLPPTRSRTTPRRSTASSGSAIARRRRGAQSSWGWAGGASAWPDGDGPPTGVWPDSGWPWSRCRRNTRDPSGHQGPGRL